MTLPAAVVPAFALFGVVLVLGLYLILVPGPARVPIERRRPQAAPAPSRLTAATTFATGLAEKVLTRRGRIEGGSAVLDRAGVKMRLQDLAVLVVAIMLAAVAVGYVLAGPLLALVLGLAVPLGARVRLGAMGARRQRLFADQLDDSMQLMATSLRAGHSLLQALNSVSREAEEPTAAEFSRIINETRVGRELSLALDETAQRMQSDDFVWVTQAVAINREVGGNLAEVLDGVGHTIRERNQIRRQVKALAAEGKLSAIVLMALPFGIIAFLLIANPSYLAKFTQSIIGYGLMAVAAVLLVVGGLWLRKVVSFKF
jgi:tight adherence protein B